MKARLLLMPLLLIVLGPSVIAQEESTSYQPLRPSDWLGLTLQHSEGDWQLGVTANKAAEVQNLPEIPDEPWWARGLREGRIPWNDKEPKEWYRSETIEAYLKPRFVPGKTTLKEAQHLLGERLPMTPRGLEHAAATLERLDDPPKDGIDVYPYLLVWCGSANYWMLYLVVDRETSLVVDWGYSGAICGFCPHILAHDGTGWRLEGKMLAGRIGRERAGADVLRLPQLSRNNDGDLPVRLCNIAPEVEYLREPQLLSVALGPEEALDFASDGEPVLWRPQESQKLNWSRIREEAVKLNRTGGADVLILEAMNNSRMEAAMRQFHLQGEGAEPEASLRLVFNTGESVSLPAVGTKFLRRVVVELPANATEVRLESPDEFWFVHRVWTGQRLELAPERLAWSSPRESLPPTLQLSPMEEVALSFRPQELAVPEGGRMAYALKLSGYYELLPEESDLLP